MSVLWTSPAWSWPLLLIVAVGAIILTLRFYDQSRPQPGAGLGPVLVILRSTALLLLVLALAGPVLSRFVKKEVRGQLVFLIEDSASMALLGSLNEESHWGQSLAAVAAVDSTLDVLGLNVETRVLRGNGLGELHEFGLDDPVINDPVNHGTNLSALLRKASNRLAAQAVRAVVLLSDGQETVRMDTVGDKQSSSSKLFSNASFYAAGVGDNVGSVDRLLKDIRYPETAFAGDQILIEATVMQRSLDHSGAQPVTVRLKQNNVVLVEKIISAGPGATNFEMAFIPGKAGLQMLELEVSSLDNERFLANNRVSLGIDIHKARSRILMLAEKPGWNVRFLAQAAQRESRLSLEIVYASSEGLVFADSLVPFVEPGTVNQWQQYDGVILSGWNGVNGRLDHSLLRQAVDAGLGLMVLPESTGIQTRRLTDPGSILKAILPVSVDQLIWANGPLFAHVDSLAFDHPVFSGLPEVEGLNLLAQVPPLPGVVQCTTKDGFITLLSASRVGLAQNDALPLLVVGKQSGGRVAFWSGSRLWEVSFWANETSGGQNDKIHAMRQIVRNLLVWLADGTQESGLVFVGRQPFYQEGESIGLAGQWRDMRGKSISHGRVSLEMKRQDTGFSANDTRTFPVSGFDSMRGLYEFNLPPMPPGRYTVQLMGHGENIIEGPVEELVITSHSVEQTQVRQDSRRLGQLSERYNGRYFNLHGADEVKDLAAVLAGLDWDSSELVSRRRWDPSSGWPFLVTVVLLLACEWFLRRRHGLL